MERKVTSLITQMRPAYFSVDCGMAYIIRVCDGRFVLIDSCDGEYEEKDHLWEILVSQNEGSDKPVIAAWFITHAHSDHFRGFVKFMDKYGEKVQLESIIYGWPSEDVCPLLPGDESPAEFDELVASLSDKVQVITPYTGQRFVYADAVFDVLFTWKDIGSGKIPNLNDTSLVLRMDLAGRRVLWLGDMQGQTAEYLCRHYPKEAFQCEILQVAHHGYNGASDEFYRKADPKVLLWSCPDFWFPVVRLWETNDYLIKSPNIRTTIVAGQGEVVLDMTKPIEEFQPYPEVPEGGIIYAEDFDGERVIDLHWSCVTGGATGYQAAEATLKQGICCLKTAVEDAYAVCQFVQPGQMANAKDFTLTFSGKLEKEAEKFGLFWDYPSPTIFSEEHALWLETEEDGRFTFRLTADSKEEKARLYLYDKYICEMPYKTYGGLYFILKNASVQFEHIRVVKG